MNADDLAIAFPVLPGYSWRLATGDDRAQLRALVQPSVMDGYRVSRPLAEALEELGTQSAELDHTVCIQAEGQGVVAFAHVSQPEERPRDYRVLLTGYVHPKHQQQGLGSALLHWSEAQARQLLSSRPMDRPKILRIDTDAVTAYAVALYVHQGFELSFAENEMHRQLNEPLPPVPSLPDVWYLPWSSEHAGHFFAAYDAAFRDRPGFPGWSETEWIEWITGTGDFRPDLSFVTMVAGEAAGFIMCDVDQPEAVPADQRAGWINQVGVRPEYRGRGVADALIGMVLQRFEMEGLPYAKLFVNVNNPRAVRVYERLGFVVAQRRWVYQKLVERVDEA